MENEVQQLKKRVDELERFIKSLTSSTTIPFEIESSFRKRLLNNSLLRVPRGSVTEPAGGATVDAAARTAIVSIVTRLEDLGLIQKN